MALHVGAVRVDHPRDHVVDRDERRDRRVGLRKLFDDRDGVRTAEGGAADVLADVDAAEAELGVAERFTREVFVLIPFERVRREFGLCEVTHRLDDRGALVRTHREHVCDRFARCDDRLLRHSAASFRAAVGTLITLADFLLYRGYPAFRSFEDRSRDGHVSSLRSGGRVSTCAPFVPTEDSDAFSLSCPALAPASRSGDRPGHRLRARSDAGRGIRCRRARSDLVLRGRQRAEPGAARQFRDGGVRRVGGRDRRGVSRSPVRRERARRIRERPGLLRPHRDHSGVLSVLRGRRELRGRPSRRTGRRGLRGAREDRPGSPRVLRRRRPGCRVRRPRRGHGRRTAGHGDHQR